MAQQNSSEEIDLGYLFRKSNDFFRSVIRTLFQILNFFKKYYIIVIALLIIGFGYGYYKDLNSVSSYNNELIVIPNFESVDYLYDKVEAVNNKIGMGDTLYLQEVLGTNFGKLNHITIEPIVDIYNFISKSYRNYDVFQGFQIFLLRSKVLSRAVFPKRHRKWHSQDLYLNRIQIGNPFLKLQ